MNTKPAGKGATCLLVLVLSELPVLVYSTK